MKSLFSGALLGLLAGGIAAGAASVIAPQPAGNTPPATPQVQAPMAATDAPEVVETQPEVAEVTEAVTETLAPDGLDTEEPAVLPDTDTTPPDLPEAIDVATDLTVPDQSEAPDIVAGLEEPVLPNPQSIAPQVPVSEDDLVVSTQPAEAPAPAPVIVVEEDGVSENVDAEADPVETVEVVDTPEVAETVEAEEAVEVAQAPEIVAPEVVTEAPSDVQAPASQDSDVTAPEAEDAGPTGDDTPVLDAPAPGDAEPEIADTGTQTAPVVISVNDGETGSRLPQGVSDIPVNRATESDEAPQEEVAEATPIDPDAPAIAQFATPFENPEAKPIMSVILLDDGSLAGSAAALAKVPFPVTVVLDPTQSSAADAMTAYRDAGIEVAVLAALPEGARPSDVEVAFGAAFGALPESVALIDPGQGNLQNDRAVMAQAMAALAEDGRGLVTISRGLNTGVQAAQDAGVPTGLIFRDLDADGQDARVIRRFLDQAAFRARQEPGVILLARVRAETLEALVAWGDANRAGQVAMAPVSAVLADQ